MCSSGAIVSSLSSKTTFLIRRLLVDIYTYFLSGGGGGPRGTLQVVITKVWFFARLQLRDVSYERRVYLS